MRVCCALGYSATSRAGRRQTVPCGGRGDAVRTGGPRRRPEVGGPGAGRRDRVRRRRRRVGGRRTGGWAHARARVSRMTPLPAPQRRAGRRRSAHTTGVRAHTYLRHSVVRTAQPRAVTAVHSRLRERGYTTEHAWLRYPNKIPVSPVPPVIFRSDRPAIACAAHSAPSCRPYRQ